jgi:KDO2-lipid IV(A) lauroyltransferase
MDASTLQQRDNETYFKDGQLTALFVKTLEDKIKKEPANYLWSHRRWRHPYDATTYGHLVVES